MDDTTLIKKAAMAAGIELGPWQERQQSFFRLGDPSGPAHWWNPLTDDGDALRLAVALRMEIQHFALSVRVAGYNDSHEVNGADPCAATRRAIVSAAADVCDHLF